MKKILFSLLVVCLLVLTGCGKESSRNFVKNTTWTGSDESEVIFTDTRIDWYQSAEDHNDNYYSGEYKLYTGKKAVNYITKDLSEYGITKEELQRVFDSRDEFKEKNFVVFDIRYDKFVLDGEEQEITRPLVPWFGFILEDDTFLYVVNMNTASYYSFTKK